MEASPQARCSWCLTPSQAIPKLQTYNLVCRPIHLNEWSKRPNVVLRPNLDGNSIFHPIPSPLQAKAYFPRENYSFVDACTQTICQLFACFLMPYMLFMLCVVYPFVDCFCLPICASHVHSLVVYMLYIYLSVASIYFFVFHVSICLLAYLQFMYLLGCSCSMLHMLLPCVSCILPFVPLPPIHATCTSLIIFVLVFSMPFPICLVHVHAFTCCFMHTYVHFSFMLVLVCHAPVLLVYVHAFICCFMHTSVCLFVTQAFIIFDRGYF